MADREPLLRGQYEDYRSRKGGCGGEGTAKAVSGIASAGASNGVIGATSDGRHDEAVQITKDDALLNAQGHKAEMQRSFSPLAALGLGFSITNSWAGFFSCFGQNLAYAGPNSVVFGLIVGVAIQWMISLGLYELASCFPCSGGQHHFVFILAPPRHKRSMAFFVGWMNILAWAVAICGAVSVVVASVAGLIAVWVPAYEISQLQSYLLYLFLAILSALPLFIGPRAIPTILQASLSFTVLGFLITTALLLFFRQQTHSPAVLLDTHGSSGWKPGMGWILGVANAMYPFSSTDAAIHIAEEMIDPARRLPQTLNMTLAIGIATALPLAVLTMLCATDIPAVLRAPLPYAEAFLQITGGNRALTTFLTVWITLVLFSALIGQWVTVGRLTWAFARDGGLLSASEYFATVSPRFGFPVRTTLLALGFTAVYGLLYLLSTTAFNSILTAAVLVSNLSYVAPQLIVAIRGRSGLLPPNRAFDLGVFGVITNCLAPAIVGVLAILVCFPPELPVTGRNANYTPAILVCCAVALTFAWRGGGGHRIFKDPRIDCAVLKNVPVI